MARSKHTLGSLFARLLAPLTAAVEAETGKRLSAPQWGTVARKVTAAALRGLAKLVDVKPEPKPAAEPVATVAANPAPVPVFAPAVLDIPSVPADVKPLAVPAKPKTPARNPATKAQPKAKPVTSAARTTKPAKSKAPVKAKPSKPAGKRQDATEKPPARKPAGKAKTQPKGTGTKQRAKAAA